MLIPSTQDGELFFLSEYGLMRLLCFNSCLCFIVMP